MGGAGIHTPLLQFQLRPPPLRPGLVERTTLIERLAAVADARTVTIVAPPGYGKTTLMSLWKEQESRPTGWLSLDRYDNDPAILHSNVAAALQHSGMLGELSAGDTRIPSDLVISYGVARLADALDTQGAAGVLMLDHAEVVQSRASNDAIAELAARLPPTVQFVIASRTSVRLPVGRLRAEGGLLELTATDLAMGRAEALQLLANAGVDIELELDELIEHTEGWPAGLYLVASGVKAGSARQATLRISGKDRFVADYLREEVLGGVSGAHLSFLLRTSILDQFCGPLCDAVLGVTGSAQTIEHLEASNLLVVPLDRSRDWYRYHHLLQEFLQAELIRREPDLVAELHSRAAAWFEANDRPEEAITHAQAADDADTVARIVGRVAQRTAVLGRGVTAREWFRWFEQTGRIDRYPEITAKGGLAFAVSGDVVRADRWVAALPPTDPHPAGKVLRGIMARAGLDQVRADARAAQHITSAEATWQPAGFALEGFAHLWDGDAERAEPLLARSASMGGRLQLLNAMTIALSGQAAIAVGQGDWEKAEQYIAESLDQIHRYGLERYVTSALTFALAARCAAHQGQIDLARRRLAHATTIRPSLTTATPGISVHALLEMARAHLALSDVAGARTVVRQSADVLVERPDLGLLPKQHDELRTQLDTMTASTVGASSLTTAELRLLPFLVTHLSFPEIGERLYISRHTVKTQAMSIYRKLGASSRSEAVQHAKEAGLLTA